MFPVNANGIIPQNGIIPNASIFLLGWFAHTHCLSAGVANASPKAINCVRGPLALICTGLDLFLLLGMI